MEENSETFSDPGQVTGLKKSAPWQDLVRGRAICREPPGNTKCNGVIRRRRPATVDHDGGCSFFFCCCRRSLTSFLFVLLLLLLLLRVWPMLLIVDSPEDKTSFGMWKSFASRAPMQFAKDVTSQQDGPARERDAGNAAP